MKKQKVLSALLAMTMFCTMAPPAAALAEETNTEAVEDYSSDHSLEVMGGKLGKDYTIENGVITVKTSTPLTIYGAGENVRGKIVISENVEANIALEALRLFSQDGAALEISKNSTANVKGVNDDLNNENGDFSSLSGSDQSQAILIQNSGMLNIDVEGGCRLNCEGVIKNDGSIAIDGSGIFEIGEYQSNPSVDGGKMIVNNGIVRFYSIDVDKFEVNGGEVGVRNEESGAINADKCVINNGLIDWFIENYDSWNNDDVIGPRLFVSDSLQIKGGDFYGGNISRNSVYGCPVVDGKAVSVKQFNEDRGYPKFTVVDDDQINSLQVSGTGGSYKNRVLTLNDGADVIISSKGQTNDNIQVGDYNNPVHATLTLSGVDIHSAKPTIFVEEGSSLTLILKDGTNNRLQSVGAEMSAIRVKDYDRYDHSDSVLTIQGKETLNVQGRNSGIGAAGGQINIENGNIIATLGSSAFGAAIGGEYRSHAQINISGGTIKAEGATGIGSGYGDADIMISGGNIEAIGHLGAAIGNGNLGQGGSILIEDGHIYATTDCGSAAIGGGVDSSIEEITIKGGNIIAETKPESYYQSSGAAIGTGYARGNLDNPDQERNSSVGNISISGGNIIAKSGTGAAAIGSGQSLDGYITQVGFIEITGGTVEAYGGKGAAGIGAGKGGIDGTFSTGDGDPVIITNSISDQNSESVWNGVFIVDNMNKGIGKVYGDTVNANG
ncbi:MAG: hypothetical protein UDB11_04740 [Peptococcaceae bacterium]|nr:hypothetical protein [Peptococcaceae bacterium]